MKLSDLFTYDDSLAKELLERAENLWDPLDQLNDYVLELQQTLDPAEYTEVADGVFAHQTAHIHPSCYLNGPMIIGPEAELRFSVYLRGPVILDRKVVLATATEVKNAILLEGATCPHYNYVGDSIMGKHAHIGAGVIFSNLRGDRGNINLYLPEGKIETGRRKFGAYLGDNVEVGCNSVLNPGTILGKNCLVYPIRNVRGYHPENSVIKDNDI